MRKLSFNWWGASLAVGTALAMVGQANEAKASSHREAPFVTKSPKIDNTDFYMFRSYEANKADTVTVLANFQPLQDAYGGPNYFSMDPEALYEIHFDTDGNGVEDLTFQFRFKQTLNVSATDGVTLNIGPTGDQHAVAIPFINANVGGQVIDATNQNNFRHVLETYSVNVVRGPRRTGAVAAVAKDGGGDFVKPLDYVGTKSLGDAAAYKAYSEAHIFGANIPAGDGACAAGGNIRVFAGQRQEGFAVLLGNIFDLVNARTDDLLAAGGGTRANPIGTKNVTTLALEIPIACLATEAQPVVGGWSTASVRQARAINPNATYGTPSKEGGAWAQVSRLGNPLVNEVVIGLKDKDKFNSSEPKDDLTNFGTYIQYPTLPAVLEALFGAASVKAPTVFPRADLVAAFATGVPSVNAIEGGAVAEMLRLNTAVGVTAGGGAPGATAQLGAAGCFVGDPTKPDQAKTLNLAAVGCDPAGFPNGRRPGDDTVDIALRVMMGYLLGDSTVLASTTAPNADLKLGDSVPQNAAQFMTKFPYLNTPNAGAVAPTGLP